MQSNEYLLARSAYYVTWSAYYLGVLTNQECLLTRSAYYQRLHIYIYIYIYIYNIIYINRPATTVCHH